MGRRWPPALGACPGEDGCGSAGPHVLPLRCQLSGITRGRGPLSGNLAPQVTDLQSSPVWGRGWASPEGRTHSVPEQG